MCVHVLAHMHVRTCHYVALTLYTMYTPMLVRIQSHPRPPGCETEVYFCIMYISWLLIFLTFGEASFSAHSASSCLPSFSELEGIQARELREIASTQRSKTVITGDMMPLVEALPQVEGKGPKVGPAPSKPVPLKRRNNGKYTKRCENCNMVSREQA